jgi:hypothetical protein
MAKCKGPACGREIAFVITPNGKRTPVDKDGTPHWATCVDSEEFKARTALEKRLAELRSETGG